jgi:hypothetical protein
VSRLTALAPPAIFSLTLAGVRPAQGRIAAPWPDLLISCGRRAGLAAMAIRRRSQARMIAVHIQPPTAPAAFDLVVAMPHDRLRGGNVVRVDTALHGIRGPALQAAAVLGDARFDGLPRPWTAVLLGGDTGRTPFTASEAMKLADGLDDLRAQTGGSLLITASRRTPAAVIAALGGRYVRDTSTFFWDGGGNNPYLAILARADAIVATDDSISMVSEALATTAEVWVFEVGDQGGRHASFLKTLYDKRLVARLGDSPPPRRSHGIDATPLVADIVRDLMHSKLDSAYAGR